MKIEFIAYYAFLVIVMFLGTPVHWVFWLVPFWKVALAITIYIVTLLGTFVLICMILLFAALRTLFNTVIGDK